MIGTSYSSMDMGIPWGCGISDMLLAGPSMVAVRGVFMMTSLWVSMFPKIFKAFMALKRDMARRNHRTTASQLQLRQREHYRRGNYCSNDLF